MRNPKFRSSASQIIGEWLHAEETGLRQFSGLPTICCNIYHDSL
jgi:hypothetical protein